MIEIVGLWITACGLLVALVAACALPVAWYLGAPAWSLVPILLGAATALAGGVTAWIGHRKEPSSRSDTP